jgi:hypothetical protein
VIVASLTAFLLVVQLWRLTSPSALVAVLGGVFGYLVPGWALAVLALGVLARFGSYNRLVKT